MRIGIIGCGIRGQLFARALSSVDGVEVVGMSDAAAAVRERVAQAFGLPVLKDHRQLIDRGLDALVVATPDFAHRAVAVDGAAAGLALMVEKPLATTAEDAEAVRDAVDAAGVSCLVAFENRWNPYFLAAKAAIDRGDLGEVVSVDAVLSNTTYVPTRMLPWSASSSPAWFLMPHTVDLTMWLTGQRPEVVSAWGRRGELSSRGIDTWDAVHALVGLDRGGVGNLRSSWILPETLPSIVDFRVEIAGTEGTVSINHSDQGYRSADGTHYRLQTSLPVDIDGAEQSMAAWMVRSWARGLLSGEPVGPDATHGLEVTTTVAAIHSAITAGPVHFESAPQDGAVA